MIEIHKSHSKKELCDIIRTFEIPIDNPTSMKKSKLLKELSSQLELMDTIKPELDRYVFYNYIDMIQFLKECNPKKVLTVKEKNDVILNCRKVQQYIRNLFDIRGTQFTDKQSVYNMVDSLVLYGDIPSVRRVCRDINKDPYKPHKFNAVMSKQTKRELEIRGKLKQTYSQKLEVKSGSFVLSFS